MTGWNSNINDLIQKFEGIKNAPIDPTNALTAGVNAAMAAMQNRIFNQGKDAFGKPFGKYKPPKKNSMGKGLTKKIFSLDAETKDRTIGFVDFTSRFSPYELKRLNAGRQVLYKDLEFTGDLRRGFRVVKQGFRVVCMIPNETLALIMKGQEQQLKTTIAALAAREREIMVTNINAILKQEYDRLFRS